MLLHVLVLLLITSSVFGIPNPASESSILPTVIAHSSTAVPGRWIVVMKESVSTLDLSSNDAQELPYGIATSKRKYFQIDNFKGYTGQFSRDLINNLSNNPNVSYIEQDTVVRLYQTPSSRKVQKNAPWGLARISHKQMSGSNEYIYDVSGGKGTYVYVIDTGIHTKHKSFGGRAIWGVNLVDRINDDEMGHGTHVAGTIGSDLWGVAKATTMIAVKVIGSDGSGSASSVLAGIQWVVEDVKARGRIGNAFINMSIGGQYSEAINDAVDAAVQAGIFFGVAAGNEAAPAHYSSPASSESACTVGATDMDDSRAYYSNFGPSVNIFAPGTDIKSAGIGGKRSTDLMTGTSMATPHVVGLAAYLRTLEGFRSPKEMCERIKELAVKGAISMLGATDTVNLLANNGIEE